MTDKRFYSAAEIHLDHLIEVANELKLAIHTADQSGKEKDVDKTHRLSTKLNTIAKLINTSVYEVKVPISMW